MIRVGNAILHLLMSQQMATILQLRRRHHRNPGTQCDPTQSAEEANNIAPCLYLSRLIMRYAYQLICSVLFYPCYSLPPPVNLSAHVAFQTISRRLIMHM